MDEVPVTRTGPRSSINPPVFFGATAIILALLVFAALAPETAETVFVSMQSWATQDAGWFYVLAVGAILILVLFLGLSRFGDIKLGPDHSEPDYSYSSWFAMLFSAGMGIGLMFFGVSEPVQHYLSPPAGEPGSIEAAREAMKLTFFHWGLHAWSIYAIVGLILAYFSFRHGLPLTLRSALHPMIGNRIYGPIGHAVDIFAIIGTVFGVATSLGFGVDQVNSGLSYLFGIPDTILTQVMLIGAITGLATISVVTGLDAGIRRLSELNLALAGVLMLFILVLGPTVFLLQSYVQNTGAYLSDLVNKTFNLYAYEPTDWIGGWTLFYWGWWLAWSPFVGMFIARISRGRTIRQFTMGVMLVPAGFTLLWMTVFGGSAVHLILFEGANELATAIQADSAVALFKFFEYFPLTSLLSLIATVMVVVFFVTSSDSGSMVVDMLASGGRDDTPVWQRIFWAGGEGVVAIVLLLSGGLVALQTATIVSALPFTIVLIAAAYGLVRALQVEGIRKLSQQHTMNLPPRIHVGHRGMAPWRQRLRTMVTFPARIQVLAFIKETVVPALQEVALELRSHGLDVDVREEDDRAYIDVSHAGEIDFSYGVRARGYDRPSIGWRNLEESKRHREKSLYYRAEVFLREGGQDYDIMSYTQDQVISDVLDQYEKHMHFLHALR